MLQLTISPSAAPFPFAALVAAANLNVPVNFDDTGKNLALQGGPSTSDEFEIITTLAKPGPSRLELDDPKVSKIAFHKNWS
jgi:hypothetical protein